MGHARRHFVEMMSHEHHGRCRRIVDDVGQGAHELFASAEVETGRGFVEQHHLGIVHEGTGEQDALLFARRQGSERTLGESAHPEAFEAFVGSHPIGVVVGVPPGFEGGVAGGHHDVTGDECWPQIAGQ